MSQGADITQRHAHHDEIHPGDVVLKLIEQTRGAQIIWSDYNPNKRAYSAYCNDIAVGVSQPRRGRYRLWVRVSMPGGAQWMRVKAPRAVVKRLWNEAHAMNDTASIKVANALRDIAGN